MSGNLCAYSKCTNSRAKVKGLKMFSFPLDNAKIWAEKSGNADLLALSPKSLGKKVLCERHFRQQDIMPSGRLSKGALPFQYIPSDIRSAAEPSSSSCVQTPSPRVRRALMSPRRYPGKKENPSPSVSTASANFFVEEMSPSVGLWIENASPDTHKVNAKRVLFSPSTKTRLNQGKILASKRAQISKLRRQLQKLKGLKKSAMDNMNFKTKEAALLFKMQNHKKRRPWTKDEKKLATSLYLRSPSTYRYLSKIMILPGESTVRQWLSSKKCHSTGFNKNLMEQIRIKAETMTQMEKACVVMFDGMAIKQCLEYSPQYDLIEGFEDMGSLGRTNKLAKEATVFMIRGLYYQWKLPIGYFISEKGLNGKQSKDIVASCIKQLQNVGLSVKAIVCDQSSTNTKAYKELGIGIDRPYFEAENGDKIFAIFDPPHLLKSLRNNLLTHDFTSEGKTISFSDIRKLFDIETKSETTRAAHQLTISHINPNNFQKMSVSLAAQVFSHTTSAALKTAVSTGQLQTSTATNTADFLSKINSIFDAMNSRTLYSKNPDRRALSQKNIHITNLFKEAIIIFLNLEKLNSKYIRPPCFDGFVLTIRAFLELMESENNYILTSRLNQDPLENLFSSIRQRGGFNRNPTVRILRATLKIFTIQQILEPPKNTSYDPDLDELLEIPVTDTEQTPSQLTEDITDVSSQASTTSSSGEDLLARPLGMHDDVTIEECSQVYFAGYLVKNYNNKYKCKHCFEIMCNSESSLNSRKELLILNRSFSNIKVDTTSGLLSPSDAILHVTSMAFKVFNKLYKKIAHKKGIVRRLVRVTEKIVSCDAIVCSSCSRHSNYVLSLLFKVLIHKKCKWVSSNLKECSTGKLKILKHV